MWQSHSEQLYINKHHLPVSLSRLTLSNKQTPIDQLVPKQLYLSHRHGRIGSCPQTSEQVARNQQAPAYNWSSTHIQPTLHR